MKTGRELDAAAFLISKKCLVFAGEQLGGVWLYQRFLRKWQCNDDADDAPVTSNAVGGPGWLHHWRKPRALLEKEEDGCSQNQQSRWHIQVNTVLLLNKRRRCFCAHLFLSKKVYFFSSSIPRLDKCYKMSQMFTRTGQTFGSARSLSVIFEAFFFTAQKYSLDTMSLRNREWFLAAGWSVGRWTYMTKTLGVSWLRENTSCSWVKT